MKRTKAAVGLGLAAALGATGLTVAFAEGNDPAEAGPATELAAARAEAAPDAQRDAWLTQVGEYVEQEAARQYAIAVFARLADWRMTEVQDGLPDALDLMTVCVEAGLGLDAAMNRAASEIGLRSEALQEELNLVALELRVGVKRELALRNLALRTGVDDVASFVAMIVQADRFGTNVAEALRIQGETMRTHRRLRAEERAAKIPLKLLFPLIFFIFPSLMLVLMGPAMISIYRVLLPTMGGNG